MRSEIVRDLCLSVCLCADERILSFFFNTETLSPQSITEEYVNNNA